MPKTTTERVTQKAAAKTKPEGRVPIMVHFEQEMLAEVDDFRFGNRFPSRLGAVRALIRKGLDAK